MSLGEKIPGSSYYRGRCHVCGDEIRHDGKKYPVSCDACEYGRECQWLRNDIRMAYARAHRKGGRKR
jgi:hypothetical protein